MLSMMQVSGSQLPNAGLILSQAVNYLQLREHGALHCMRGSKTTRLGGVSIRSSWSSARQIILAATGCGTPYHGTMV